MTDKSERDNIISSEKKMKTQNRTKLLTMAVDQSIVGQQNNQRINLKAGSDFVGLM